MNEIYTTRQSEAIAKAVSLYNFLKMGDDGILEIYCDHHMLNTCRTCEQKFITEIIERTQPRPRATELFTKQQWSLDFGVFFHQCMEWFDEAEDKNFTGEWNDNGFMLDETLAKQWGVDSFASAVVESDGKRELAYLLINHATWITRCRKYFVENKLDAMDYQNLPNWKELNGWLGTGSLLLQYWNMWGQGKERLRTVGNELCFGRDREVPILELPTKFPWAPFRCYLTGRIDRIVDNGSVIGPMDRKTHRYFKGGEFDKYKPNDAFVGYAYAIQCILKSFPADRKCNGVIVDMVALKEPGPKTKDKQRFKRAHRDFYPSDFTEFIERNISTFSTIFQLVVDGRPPQWNTNACHNQYYRACQYKALHEVTPEIRPSIFKSFYQYREKPWNPYPQKGEMNIMPNEDEQDNGTE